MAESCLQMKPYSLTKLSVACEAPGMGFAPPVLVPFEYTLYRNRSVGNEPFRMVVLLAAVALPPVTSDSSPRAMVELAGDVSAGPPHEAVLAAAVAATQS